MTLTAIALANITYDSVALSACALFVLCLGYVVMYGRMVKHRWF